jgi:eukaryotic-like serine/threonine-protein kinase
MSFLKITKYLIIISIFFILANSFTPRGNNVNGLFDWADAQENFLLYENPKLKYTLQYPSDWQKEERLNDFVTFTAPILESGQYRYPAGLGISAMSTNNASLNTIANVHTKNMTNNLKDFQLIESSNAVLADNKPAKKIIFTAIDKDEKRKALQLITKNNDKVFLITYKADIDKYEKYLPIIQKMLASLVFLK